MSDLKSTSKGTQVGEDWSAADVTIQMEMDDHMRRLERLRE